ncbi:RNA exonuclease 4 isoform X2 [Cottoperca gobio]|uniref:RNA exonuclease 4 n=1 Tax=Cottoperca gobio TaxID=56716 RepID=A0A6J2RST4_COTGO|nr:RNA exonuclease 4 isoform X1 [Cottoperca gobio]XP_029312386.1 RNA exonuclease 4 isoform X2 [Cottoperca gobio]
MQNILPKVAIMPDVKEKTKVSPAKKQGPTSTEKTYTVKKKRKQWMKEKFKNIKPQPKKQEKAKVQQAVPPKDGLQFSANWKTLQEMLKASQPEKKQPIAPKPLNGALQEKEAKEKKSKNMSKNNVCPGQTDTGKKVKHKTSPKSVVPKDAPVNSKVPAVSETKPSAALKRKKDSGKSNDEQAAKKKKKKEEKKKEKPVDEEKKPTEKDLWFDDVDPDDIEATVGAEAAEIMRKKQGIHKNKDTESSLVKEKAFEGLTRAVAIDCEMVGVGPDGEDSILARVSLVNQFGKCIYDKYVKPTEKVTDYRTAVSGIRPEDIIEGEDVQTVQREVAEILQGRIVVGHAIHNDLKILLLDHPKKKIRDTQKYKPFKKSVKSGRPSLKLLCREILNVKVQQGEHSSVQDAQATMRLYTMVKKQWEAEIKASHNNRDSAQKRERKPKSSKNRGKNLRGL